MSFTELYEELFLVIRDYIYSNQSMINLRTTSKYFKLLGDKYGIIKRLKYNINTNFFSFLSLYDKPEFLDSLEAELTQILLEKWPRLHKNTTEIINEFNESNESGERNKQISTRIQDLIGNRETELLSHLSNLIL